MANLRAEQQTLCTLLNSLDELLGMKLSYFVIFSVDSKVLLCVFHREQAWDRNIKRKDYGVGEDLRQNILGALRRIACAR